ncbi:hypothetical protein LOZ58_003252 [Ophidiomyces ophidiicola]|nr:hypothetical protein LOZ58_003252 [Ophidiomyces ophidiicola]
MGSTPGIPPNDKPNTSSNGSTGIFPSLTDGYISDCTNHGINGKTFRVDIKTSEYNTAAQVFLDSEIISDEATAVAAWSLTISKYIGADEVSFYILLTERSQWRVSVCHLAVQESQSQLQFLRHAQRLLYGIRSGGAHILETPEDELSDLASQSTNTAIVFHNGSPIGSAPALENILQKSIISLDVLDINKASNLYLSYHNCMLSDNQAANVGTTFAKVFSILKQKAGTSLGSIDYMSKSHLDQLWKFNSRIPEQPWMECFHDVVERHALENPSAPAIDSWDARLTYCELNTRAARLAKYLQNHGVCPGVIVPICFERSSSAIIAMLAVSKAGGAFVSIPPYLPPGRRDAMIQMVAPPFVLTTSDHGHLWTAKLSWIPIEGDRIERLQNCEGPPISNAQPKDMFYVIFTSGSTGTPKGCIVSHSSFLNGALRKAPEWKFGPNRRVLQMLSHTFDMSLLEIGTSLGSGACVCVPRTEEIEESLACAINKYNITLAVMTPSLARRLEPQAVPGLRVLCLGGEPFPKEIVTLWSERINLFQFYGPSECSINSSSRAVTHKNTDPLNIGDPNNAACWVVDSGDYNRLVPVGAIGELLVSGPIVGLGYLKDPIKTSQVFLDDVAFLQGDSQYQGFRCYKTGDLVRWNSDGTINFCGRGDTQVKLNGQRLELGEVEYHLTLNNNVRHAVTIVPKVGRCRDNLMSVISLKSTPQTHNMVEDILPLRDQPVDSVVLSLRTQLQNALPRYMVPTIWAFVNYMPMSASGKIDRVRVRRWVEEMPETTFSEITGGNPNAIDDFEPTTKLEYIIQEIWSSVLNIPPLQVGLHLSFIQLGGNSILAQDAVAKCRKKNVSLSMTDILTCEGVARAASLATLPENNGSSNKPSTFKLAAKNFREGYNWSRFAVTNFDEIEDIYPCTSMQVGMFIGQIRKPGSYHLRFFYKLANKTGVSPDLGKIKTSWYRVVAHHPSLRTVFLDDLGADAEWHSLVLRQPQVDIITHEVAASTSPSEAMDIFTHSLTPFAKDSPPHRVTVCVCDGKAIYLMLEVSHALVDGAAMESLMKDFANAYGGMPFSHNAHTYRDFVEYVAQRNTEASAKYWTSYLENCPPCIIPVSRQMVFDNIPTRFLRKDFNYEKSHAFLSRCKERHITVASAVRVAWALVLRAYTGSRDVSFTYVAAGRDVPIKDVDKMVGLCLSIQPCRARLEPSETLISLTRKMQQEYIESMPYQHYPLTEMKARLYPEGSEAMFNTAVSMEWTTRTDPYSSSPISFEEIREQDDPTEYDIVANVDILNGAMKLGFLYWPSYTEDDVICMANAFMKALSFFLEYDDIPIDSVSLLDATDLDIVKSSQHSPLVSQEISVLDTIEKFAVLYPDAPAIVSWDGQYSYNQMVELYSKLAKHLIKQGVSRGDSVVACLNKSCWSTITILAILKSGAAFVATNPLHSQQRLHTTVRHCGATLILAEPKFISFFEAASTRVISINKATVEASLPSVSLPILNGADLATIVYTSGTTGEPKGILIDHGSLATSVLLGHGRSYRYGRETRALQFASFTFDACLQEIVTTLSHGGCVCIPSEDERLSNPSDCINQMQVNLALLTPTVARLIKPEDVPGLKTLILCGEPMNRQDVDVWAPALDLYNGYGPAETTICVSVNGPVRHADDPSNIGRPVESARFWILEMADDNRLAPLGCVGELAVESRQVSRGYLGDAKRTGAVFIEPAWLPGARVYKTGDLVRRNPDGSLSYCGRQDTQVKIRGQRVELGEVEHHVSECLPNASGVVAEVIEPAEEGKTILAVFFCPSTGLGSVPVSNRGEIEVGASEIQPVYIPKSVIEKLEDCLPCYMVPAVFFNVKSMPITISGKTDRQRLRDMGSSFSAEQLARAINGNDQQRRMPSTAVECRLQKLWASVLNVDSYQIGVDDSFFRLGGDSISAMKLVTAARKFGIALTVAEIFRHPHIDEQAEISTSSSEPSQESITVRPFEQVEGKDLEAILSLSELAPYITNVSNIEDIIPATDVQAFYVSRAIESPEEALNYFYLDFDGTVDLALLEESCQAVIDHFPILRTIFVPFGGKTYQVVIRKTGRLVEVSDAIEDLCRASDDFCLHDLKNGVKTASLFSSITILRHQCSGSRLIFRVSHAQYDGMSWPLILRCLREAYFGMPLRPAISFSSFVSYTARRATQSRTYWAKLLQGSTMTEISLRLAHAQSSHGQISKTHVTKTLLKPIPPKGITVASLVSSAWSLVLKHITGKTDVVYGFIVSGRNAVIQDIQKVVGPCMNTVPVRVTFSSTWTTVDLLHYVMDQHLSMGEADSLGFQDIVKNCTQWPADTKMDTLLQYHDIDETPGVSLSAKSNSNVAKLDWFRKPYAVPTNVEISARPNQDDLDISITADSHLLDINTARILLDSFERAIQCLSGTDTMPLGSLNLPLAPSRCQRKASDFYASSYLTFQLLCLIFR